MSFPFHFIRKIVTSERIRRGGRSFTASDINVVSEYQPAYTSQSNVKRYSVYGIPRIYSDIIYCNNSKVSTF